VNHTYPEDPTIVGEIADLTRCLCGQTVRKVARDDEGLTINEAFTLSVYSTTTRDKRVLPFLPELHPAVAGDEGNTFTWLEGWYTLEEVNDRFPVLDPRDMAWMLRRLMVVLGLAHELDIVHGAVLPSHILIHPEKHGLTLIDWCYSKIGKDRVLGETSEKYARWYPAEVHDELPVAAGTDLHMAAKTMIWLIGGDPLTDTLPDTLPREYRAFFGSLTRHELLARVDDAWQVKTLFDQLLERLYGPRTFRPFSMEP
jgi:hypothetical protein